MWAHSESYGGTFERITLKQWSSNFSENRPPGELNSWLKELQSIRDDAYTDDPIKLFMEQYEVHQPKVRQMVLFAAGAALSSSSENSQTQGRAWLDDTYDEASHDSGIGCPADISKQRVFRPYHGYLTASELKEHLGEKRYGHKYLCDAHRRLIYIADLDPLYVLALVETVPDHMVDGLRDALCMYLSLQPCLRVKIDKSGLSTFCLQFHIPYYAWQITPGETPPKRPHRKEPRDISFLTGEQTSELIFDAHVSIVIIGTGDRRWTALCFDDTYFDPEQEPGGDQFGYELNTVMDDPIFAEGKSDANKPIWDARLYFIMGVKERMKRLHDQWDTIVRKVEAGIDHIEEAHSLLSGPPGAALRHVDRNVKGVPDWIANTHQLVRNLSEKLAKTCEVWERFSAPDGDISYFLDTHSPSLKSDIIDSVVDIGETFKDLKEFQGNLKSYEKKCERFMRNTMELQTLQETMESKKEVHKNGTTAQTNILAVAPATIVSAFYAIPPNVMTFNRSATNFFFSFVAVAVCLQLLNLLVEMIRERIAWRQFWKWICIPESGIGTMVSNCLDNDMFRRQPRRRDTADTTSTLVTGQVQLQEV